VSPTFNFARLSIAAILAAAACTPPGESENRAGATDPHSFSRPDQVVVEHLELDLTVDFETRRIHGRATLQVDNRTGVRELMLDSRDLDIRRVSLGADEVETSFRLGEEVEFLGQPLVVRIEPDSRIVHIDYETGPDAIALQWFEPQQTASGRRPFLLTQSESVFARTWIPCQDSPAVRITYDATVRVPPGLLALMSAENPTKPSPDGVYTFRMRQSVPSYLLALAVGELEFRTLGPTSGIYAEPSVVERAAWEFAEIEEMKAVAEKLYGPYRWGRYDLIVLPPGFPFGGMENPRLSFITPTLLAGDRSLVATVAHELAHSWSGNLVTHASWGELWLNEGLTVYIEKRIMEALYGRDYTEMLAVLDHRVLLETLDELGPESPDTHLHLDLVDRDPEESFSDVAYEKGYLFLRMLEEALGRERWDRFLPRYFDEFGFGSMTSARFLATLREWMAETDPGAESLESRLQLDAWVYGPGLPANRPVIRSVALDRVDRQRQSWIEGQAAADLDTTGWTAHHRLHFIRGLTESLPSRRLAELDEAFGWTESGNAEILHAWLLQTLDHDYEPAEPALERFLIGVGRYKFLEPLYTRLAETPEGLERARAIYAEARPGYHSIVTKKLDEMLGVTPHP
jgi:aminopeptidase N